MEKGKNVHERPRRWRDIQQHSGAVTVSAAVQAGGFDSNP